MLRGSAMVTAGLQQREIAHQIAKNGEDDEARHRLGLELGAAERAKEIEAVTLVTTKFAVAGAICGPDSSAETNANGRTSWK